MAGKSNNKLVFVFRISLIVVVIITVLLILRVRDIDKQIKQYPVWIDATLAPILEKKVDNVPFFFKMGETAFYKGNYMSWLSVQEKMDQLVLKIKEYSFQHHHKFDAIVGIVSGGAILTKYLSEKLDIKHYYYVKLSDKDYHCKKKPANFGNVLYKNFISKDKKEYEMCSPILADLQSKNILLFDEMIYTGDTVEHTINYLLNNKGAQHVLPAAIYVNKLHYNGFDPLYVKQGFNEGVWSWGYDN